MERIPLIFPVTLTPVQLKVIAEIKDELAKMSNKIAVKAGTTSRVDLTIILGAAFNLREVVRLGHISQCYTTSYELRMAIVKIEASYQHFTTRVPKSMINDIVKLMNYVHTLENICMDCYGQTKVAIDQNQKEISLPQEK